MVIAYRPAKAHDLEAAEALVIASINDLTQRHGFGPMASARPPSFQLFSLKDDPNGLWIAEEDDKIVGFAWNWVCGSLWFLAQLFVAPAQQGRGIGNELIQRSFEHARKAGATNKALITFTFNRVSQGLYIRHGLFPKMPIYFFGGARERVATGLKDVGLRAVPISDTPEHDTILATIDAGSVGSSRSKHHRYLRNDSVATGVLLFDGGECIGYAYISSDGHIGPIAVTRTDVLGDAFATALKVASDCGSSKISAFIPGTADAALTLAIANGMQISFPMVLMANRAFGDWTRYLPRNPGYM
jgi:ribosomal protein S18 acetylase RimI-like enzyme